MGSYPTYKELHASLENLMYNANLTQAQKYNIVAHALIKGFVWETTPQRWEYWNKIHQELVALAERAKLSSPNMERIKALKSLIKQYQEEVEKLQDQDEL